MNLAPLLASSAVVKLHVATVVPAFVIGTWLIVLSKKGAPGHRVLGYLYLGLMAVTAITALFIHRVMPQGPFWGFSPIHLLVPLTLWGVAAAIYFARRGDIRRHRRAMLITYVGALLLAGWFAFSPGRIMYAVVFGP